MSALSATVPWCPRCARAHEQLHPAHLSYALAASSAVSKVPSLTWLPFETGKV